MDPRPIDVRHLGNPRVICCWQAGDVLVDPGPESCLDTLLEELDGAEPRALLLTHVHLDHAGATGALVKRWPDLKVYVHERGAPHMVDPSGLLRSAERLYGDDMDRLWGEVIGVPEGNITALSGGETVEGMRVAYTPGHASHHVSYLHEDSGHAFVGDVAGVRIPPSDLVVAPTPPPDINVEQWNESLSILAEWAPEHLGLTHFGRVDDVFAQLAAIKDRLTAQATLARTLDEDEFVAALQDEITQSAGPEVARLYQQGAPAEQLYQGLDRYWRKRDETA